MWFIFSLLTVALYTECICNYNEQPSPNVTLPYYLDVDNYKTLLYLGTPLQKHTFEIDMELPFTFTTNIFYQRHEKSLTCTEIMKLPLSNIPNTNRPLIFTLISDIWCPKNTTSSLSYPIYILFSESYFGELDRMSFSYTHLNRNVSLTHALYNHNYISTLQFSFIPSSPTNGTILFGADPPNTSKLYISTLHVEQQPSINISTTWSVMVSSSYYGSVVSLEKRFAFFQRKSQKIYIPRDVQVVLNETFFLPKQKEKMCTRYSYFGNNHWECECSVIGNMSRIGFYIQGYEFAFELDDVIRRTSYGKCVFLFEENVIDNNTYVFGAPFMNKFISTFNYEHSTITLYSPYKIPYHIISHPHTKLTAYHILIVIISITLSIGCISLYISNNLIINNLNK